MHWTRRNTELVSGIATGLNATAIMTSCFGGSLGKLSAIALSTIAGGLEATNIELQYKTHQISRSVMIEEQSLNAVQMVGGIFGFGQAYKMESRAKNMSLPKEFRPVLEAHEKLMNAENNDTLAERRHEILTKVGGGRRIDQPPSATRSFRKNWSQKDLESLEWNWTLRENHQINRLVRDPPSTLRVEDNISTRGQPDIAHSIIASAFAPDGVGTRYLNRFDSEYTTYLSDLDQTVNYAQKAEYEKYHTGDINFMRLQDQSATRFFKFSSVYQGATIIATTGLSVGLWYLDRSKTTEQSTVNQQKSSQHLLLK